MKLTRIQYDWVRIHENRKCSRCGNDRDTKLQTCFTCTQSERIRKLKYRDEKVSKGLCPPSERLILADDGKKIIQKYLGMGDGNASYIEPDCRYYLNTGSFLKTYELGVSGYAERAGYDPVELGYCNVKISGGKIEKVDRVVL